MRHQFQLRPDLTECILEDRCLLALPPGLAPSPFMSINSVTNQMVAPGSSVSSGSGGGSLIAPGPTFWYLRLGVSLNGFGQVGSSIGGTVSIFGLNTKPTALVGGGGPGAGGGGVGPGAIRRNGGGFGASFSSGFSFALSSLNNFGMSSTTGAPSTLGSVPVHTYGGGGDLMDDTQANPNGSGNAPPVDQNQNAETAPYPGPVQGPNVNPLNRSQGKNRGAATSLLNGPGSSNQS